ncbi:hypothetical protein SNE40_010988 [Patella caerulea]|uniref:Neuroendocrine protein 7B2 n=1 Tax=Patella caerulea TaxID=87958 RepID=A0AAN8K225_PATCE
MMKLIVLLSVGVCLTMAEMSLDPAFGSYYDLARMYRMKQLANLYDNYRTGDDLESRSVDNDDWVDSIAGFDDPEYKGEPYTGTNLRDQEHLEQSSLYGYQSMSGGTADGKPNEKQVKSDKSLPAYCNPPNPCPIGKTAKDNCREDFQNSAENNKKLLDEQECPCDTEHMFSCPDNSNTVSSKSQGDAAAINKVMDELQKLDADLGTDFMQGGESKRVAVVAKKSPHIIKKRGTKARHGKNPYLAGRRIRTVAKKSPPMKA